MPQSAFKSFKNLPRFGGGRPRALNKDLIRPPRGLRLRPLRSLNYPKILAEVDLALARLSFADRVQITATATLPEKIVGLALLWLGWPFQTQYSLVGGRMRLGGGVIDFVVLAGALPIVLRVQGNYWHSLPERVFKDALQLERLHAYGYMVADLWEDDLMEGWVMGRTKEQVEDAVVTAN